MSYEDLSDLPQQVIDYLITWYVSSARTNLSCALQFPGKCKTLFSLLFSAWAQSVTIRFNQVNKKHKKQIRHQTQVRFNICLLETSNLIKPVLLLKSIHQFEKPIEKTS